MKETAQLKKSRCAFTLGVAFAIVFLLLANNSVVRAQETTPTPSVPATPPQSSLPRSDTQVTSPSTDSPAAPDKPVTALPRDIRLGTLAAAPTIDGLFAAEEWKGAAKVELNFQVQPGDNTPPSEKTEVMVAADREHLYLAFHAYDSNPSAIRAPVSRRDAVYNDDYVAVYLDTFNDHQRAYVLYFNPLGIQADGIIDSNAGGLASLAEVGDLTWDGIYTSKGTITADGYIIEVALPFRTLRFQAGKDKRWGLHLQRWIARRAERIFWQPVSRDRSELLAQMGTLSGLDDVYAGRTLDLIPTITGSINSERQADPRSPSGARLNSVNRLEPGLTATYTITPNLTFTGTINPDFSQIEADVPQITVNQRFPLFFPEKRPFFLEGGEVFVSPGALWLVNTRSIVDPDWGAKLTGKIGKNTIGFLSAADRADGLRVAPTDAAYGKRAQVNIFRYARDVLKNSRVGAFVTDRRFADTSSTLYAADGQLRFRDVNIIGFQLAYSRTRGFDAETKGGATSYVWYGHQGRHWRLSVSEWRATPDYREGAGFVRRTGFVRHSGNFGYEFRPKSKSWWVSIRPFIVPKLLRITTPGENRGLKDESYIDPGAAITLARGIEIYAYRSWHMDSFQGREYPYQFYFARYSINSFKRVTLSGYVQWGEGVNFNPRAPQVGRAWNSETEITLQPNTRLNVQFAHFKSNLQQKQTGVRLFNQDILRNRTIYQFTRNNAVRLIMDYDTARRQSGLSFLYSYTPRPNTALYVGYNDLLFNGLDPLENTRVRGLFRQRRTLFTKLSYNFRF